ncbi:MAG TPA: nucleoside-diphosphate sugar epimerase/dehydratase [Vicinamibacteria bacterium]
MPPSRLPLFVRLRAVPAPARIGLILLCDAAVVSAAFFAGYFLRFEGHIPPERLAELVRWLPLLVAIRLTLHLLAGLHRWSFRLSGFHEAMRVVGVSLAGSAAFASVFFFIQRATEDVSIGPPRSVIVIEFFVTTSLLGALRFSPRLAYSWSLEKMRARSGPRVRAVIVGAGSAGELLLRDLQRSDEHSYEVVGFVDDEPSKWWTSLGGRPVLGPLESLPDVVRRRQVGEVLFAVPRLPVRRLREVLDSCEGLKLRYRILPVSFAYLNDRAASSMLQDLAPEDILPRSQVSFDDAELRALVGGRRVLVTGAAGSIGSEICRQLAGHEPARLILLDANENNLYLLARELESRFPGLAMAVELADVRDAARLRAVGRAHAPQDVVHAAAHKHVSLVELAPEEAVKTNVTGCRNVLALCEGVGAERFVLISTDKAVEAAGVMGATKRLAELIVRDHARQSATTCTTVRFGNVLGSSGSVVPIFKAQIAAGGPVTVTHPDCRRFLMTIREAVGLALRAGLHGHGDLCVLEMGEPMRIVDLARLMITLSGLVPGDEIPIVFTGLRPGEKISERLMTDEESQRSRMAAPAIRGVDVDPPPAETLREIAALEQAALEGDREGVIRRLGDLVPTYAAARAARAVTPQRAAVVQETSWPAPLPGVAPARG